MIDDYQYQTLKNMSAPMWRHANDDPFRTPLDAWSSKPVCTQGQVPKKKAPKKEVPKKEPPQIYEVEYGDDGRTVSKVVADEISPRVEALFPLADIIEEFGLVSVLSWADDQRKCPICKMCFKKTKAGLRSKIHQKEVILHINNMHELSWDAAFDKVFIKNAKNNEDTNNCNNDEDTKVGGGYSVADDDKNRKIKKKTKKNQKNKNEEEK